MLTHVLKEALNIYKPKESLVCNDRACTFHITTDKTLFMRKALRILLLMLFAEKCVCKKKVCSWRVYGCV